MTTFTGAGAEKPTYIMKLFLYTSEIIYLFVWGASFQLIRYYQKHCQGNSRMFFSFFFVDMQYFSWHPTRFCWTV